VLAVLEVLSPPRRLRRYLRPASMLLQKLRPALPRSGLRRQLEPPQSRGQVFEQHPPGAAVHDQAVGGQEQPVAVAAAAAKGGGEGGARGEAAPRGELLRAGREGVRHRREIDLEERRRARRGRGGSVDLAPAAVLVEVAQPQGVVVPGETAEGGGERPSVELF